MRDRSNKQKRGKLGESIGMALRLLICMEAVLKLIESQSNNARRYWT